MIKKQVLVTAALLSSLSIAQSALGDDLESILDDGGKAPQAKTRPVPSQVHTEENPFVLYMNKQFKKPTPDQSHFTRLFVNGEWDKALLQYNAAFEKTSFAKTPSGRAIFGYTHFQAGMPVIGLEILFQANDAAKIDPVIRDLWAKAAPASHPAWDQARIKWSPSFAKVFAPELEYRIMARDVLSIKSLPALQKLYAKLPVGSPEHAKVGWQIVIQQSVANNVEAAAKTLAEVMKANPHPVSQELMDLTAARMLFQRAHYAAAIKYYEKIPRTSDYWTDAQEEMAWSYIRKGEPQNALAVSRSLVAPGMALLAGPESYFAHSLAELKICDYPGVLTSLKEFSQIFKARYKALQETAKNSESPTVKKAIEVLKTGRADRAKLGGEGAGLPRLVARDERLFEYAQSQKALEAEASAADLVYTKSLAFSGLQGYFDKLRKDVSARAYSAGSAAQNRVRELAKREGADIQEILRKLHIVEAEVITQVSVADRVIDKTRKPAKEIKGTTGSKAKETVSYPAEDKEVWFDEIGSYKVDVKKACHAEAKGKS
jgi:hypothetical protein